MDILWNIQSLHLNYVTQPLRIKRLGQSRSFERLKMEVKGRRRYFCLKQRAFPGSKRWPLLPHYIKTDHCNPPSLFLTHTPTCTHAHAKLDRRHWLPWILHDRDWHAISGWIFFAYPVAVCCVGLFFFLYKSPPPIIRLMLFFVCS